ncbi:MAG: type II secretion system protein J [Leptothrix sp. (in: b-proteobacteria)]
MPRRPVLHPHRHSRTRGFTLVEVLVSLFILALMTGMAWQGVDMVSRSREQTQRRMDGLLRLQSTVAQWEADLAAVVDTQLMPGLAFDGATLHLTRRQDDGVQVVAWALRGGQLQRWAAPPVRSAERLQDAWFRSYQLLGNEAGTLTLLPDVARWQVYVFFSSSNAWSNALSTGDVADTDLAAPAAAATPVTPITPGGRREQLPDGLRMVLGLAEGSSAGSGTLTREVRLVHP